MQMVPKSTLIKQTGEKILLLCGTSCFIHIYCRKKALNMSTLVKYLVGDIISIY